MSNERDDSEIIEMRSRQLQNFGEWLANAGLDPLDYELVEERRGDGTVVWYFQKRIHADKIQVTTQSNN